jgi:hypothetical protein
VRDGSLFNRIGRTRAKKGQEAGAINQRTGYRFVCVDYQKYKVHRIIWAMVNRSDPGQLVVDHIDGNRLNVVELSAVGDDQASVALSPADIPTLEALIQDTPPPQAVRFTCLLDTISVSRQTVLLKADSGETVPARLGAGVDPEQLRALWSQRVLITGMAHYRPSGSIQQVAVDGLQRAEPQDELFSRAPLPASRQPVFRSEPHDQQTGVASFIGTWPGEESDEELIEALQAIR